MPRSNLSSVLCQKKDKKSQIVFCVIIRLNKDYVLKFFINLLLETTIEKSLLTDIENDFKLLVEVLMQTKVMKKAQRFSKPSWELTNVCFETNNLISSFVKQFIMLNDKLK